MWQLDVLLSKDGLTNLFSQLVKLSGSGSKSKGKSIAESLPGLDVGRCNRPSLS